MNDRCQKLVRQSDFVTELKGSCKRVSKPRHECGVCCVETSLYSVVLEIEVWSNPSVLCAFVAKEKSVKKEISKIINL
jgi:hypothetical protein